MAVYALSDLHGNKELFKKVKSFLNEKDTVFFLGDAADRGPDGWELIKTIYEDSQFIYAKGNHEDMLVNSIKEFCEMNSKSGDCDLLFYNGGKQTFNAWRKDGAKKSWAIKLEKLPAWLTYINIKGQLISMSHAGFTPKPNEFPSHNELLWSRDHFLDNWNEEVNNCIIVHGHTPIEHLLEEIDPANVLYDNYTSGALYYECGRKCCIDHGAVFTGKFILLNLDTMQETIFSTTPYIQY